MASSRGSPVGSRPVVPRRSCPSKAAIFARVPVASTICRRGMIPGSLQQVASRSATVARKSKVDATGSKTVGRSFQVLATYGKATEKYTRVGKMMHSHVITLAKEMPPRQETGHSSSPPVMHLPPQKNLLLAGHFLYKRCCLLAAALLAEPM